MISSLHGIVEQLSGTIATLNVQGVGYEVFCSQACAASLGVGEKASLVIYTDVKEDQIRLYGFSDRLEKQTFLLLMRVKGVGPKSASDIISHIDKRDLLRAIGAADLQHLQSIKGIGKKTAERIVVELKDKVGEFALENQITVVNGGGAVAGPFGEAAEALIALGFTRRDAEKAVRAVEGQGLSGTVDSGIIVREALRHI